MLSISKFRQLAGDEVQGLTDEKVKVLRDVMSQLTDHLFDMWIDGLNKDLDDYD